MIHSTHKWIEHRSFNWGSFSVYLFKYLIIDDFGHIYGWHPKSEHSDSRDGYWYSDPCAAFSDTRYTTGLATKAWNNIHTVNESTRFNHKCSLWLQTVFHASDGARFSKWRQRALKEQLGKQKRSAIIFFHKEPGLDILLNFVKINLLWPEVARLILGSL